MKRGDFAWAAIIAAVAAFLAVPSTREAFMSATAAHPYPLAFAKFFLLATMGEFLAIRIGSGRWKAPTALALRATVWGLLGVAVVLVFELFSSGVAGAQAKGLLPWQGSRLGTAFLISATMNLSFAPAMMLAHRISDTWIDLRFESVSARPDIAAVVRRIDWKGFIGFVLARTIPLFWIPAHTATFLLPPVYRVLAAAALSIALGAILAFAKRRTPKAQGAEL